MGRPDPADPRLVADAIAAWLETRPGRRAGNLAIRRALRLGSPPYLAARALLLASGRAVRGRGRGGSLRLVARPAPEEPVTVRVQRFAEILGEGPPLAVDDYQRPFVWSADQVIRLVEDLREHARTAPPDEGCYLGTLLLHHAPGGTHRYIVDGQQRLTTLCLLHRRIHGVLPAGQALRFRAVESAENLRKAARCLVDLPVAPDLLAKVTFTVITVRSEDLAFTFFDTQNNRGLPLRATDLLKACHLRAVAGAGALGIQERCARIWEDVQRAPGRGAASGDGVPHLFEKVLWRGRRWTGQNALHRESHDALLREFDRDALPAAAPDRVPVWPSPALARGASLSLAAPDRYALEVAPPSAHPAPVDFPFLLRQPIHRGLGFFLYTVKYARLYQRLFHDPCDDREVRLLREVDGMHADAGLSVYLRELFGLGVVAYADRFASDRLSAFALWLDHLLGAVRLEKKYVFREAAPNLLRDGGRNLLDVVAGAFRPEEVLAFLAGETWAHAAYEVDPVPDRGVQGRYARAVLRLYRRQGSLRGKERWIEPWLRGAAS